MTISTGATSTLTGACHGARTWTRPPTVTGWWNSRQRSAQSSAISVVATSTSAPPAAARRSGQRGELARRAVDRVLDRLDVDVDLLDAGRGEREELGEDDLGVGAAHAQRQADHPPMMRLSLPTSDSSVATLAAVIDSASFSASLRCSRLSLRGTTTLTTTRRSPRPPGTPQARHAVPAHHDHLARLRAGRDADLDVAVERRGVEARAERGVRGRDVEHGDEVVAVAQEALVGGDADEDVEVAGRARPARRVPAAAQADALAVGDALGDVDAQRAAPHLAAPPVAVLARLGRDLALAAADVARRLAHDLAERRARHLLQDADAAAALAGDDRGPGLGAVAVADLAGLDRLEAQLDAGAGRRLGERDVGVHGDVAALGRAGAAAPPEARRRRRRPAPPKNASNRSEIEPKPSKFGLKPPERRPSWP
jgi:hypothetical protein